MRGIPIELAWDEPAQVHTPPPNALGQGFAQFIDHLVDCAADTIRDAGNDLPWDAVFTDAADRLVEAIKASRVGVDSCAFNNDGRAFYAGPFTSAVGTIYGGAARVVAEAVVARDLGLIVEADFRTLTGWWVAAGFPLPPARVNAQFADDDDKVDELVRALRASEHRVENWPLAAVA